MSMSDGPALLGPALVGLVLLFAAPGCRDRAAEKAADKAERRKTRRAERREAKRAKQVAALLLQDLAWKQGAYFSTYAQYVEAPPRSDFRSLDCQKPSPAQTPWCHLGYSPESSGGWTVSAAAWNRTSPPCPPPGYGLGKDFDCMMRWYVVRAERDGKGWVKTSQHKDLIPWVRP